MRSVSTWVVVALALVSHAAEAEPRRYRNVDEAMAADRIAGRAASSSVCIGCERGHWTRAELPKTSELVQVARDFGPKPTRAPLTRHLAIFPAPELSTPGGSGTVTVAFARPTPLKRRFGRKNRRASYVVNGPGGERWRCFPRRLRPAACRKLR